MCSSGMQAIRIQILRSAGFRHVDLIADVELLARDSPPSATTTTSTLVELAERFDFLKDAVSRHLAAQTRRDRCA